MSPDSDQDGLPDFYESIIGSDPNDPDDAQSDSDGDMLSALDEYMILTNPTIADTDGDGIPDGFEVLVGLNAIDGLDGVHDKDGDGVSNIDEYLSGTQVDDAASSPAPPIEPEPSVILSAVTLSWQTPTGREDSSPLLEADISAYRIYSGTSATNLQLSVELSNTQAIDHIVEGLTAGDHYFAITTVTTDGVEGSRSQVVKVTI